MSQASSCCPAVSTVMCTLPSHPVDIVMADDFESGMRSAALGGNTTVLPFCLQEKGHSLREALKVYHAKAEGQCYVDVSFHLIITDPTDQVLGQELPALIEDGYTSFKVFMTYEGLALSDREILEVMAVARETGALVMVHAENYDAIRFLTDRLERLGKTAPQYHATSRPVPVEREATHRAISLAELVDAPIMIVHVSNCEAMEEIRQRPNEGAQSLWRDLPAIPRTDRARPRGPQHGGREICLLTAAAGRGQPTGSLGGSPARRVFRLLIRPLPLPLQRSGKARAEGTHELPLGAERHSRRCDAASHPFFGRGAEGPD